MNIWTIGYEGLSADAFMALLHHHGIAAVVDVRAVPLSRKRGFSKTALSDALGRQGLGYLHLSRLGCPKAVRERWHAEGDWRRYTVDYLAHLQLQSDTLAQLAGHASARCCALLCFEADYNVCHRSLVAQTLHSRYGFGVEHITALKKARPAQHSLELV